MSPVPTPQQYPRKLLKTLDFVGICIWHSRKGITVFDVLSCVFLLHGCSMRAPNFSAAFSLGLPKPNGGRKFKMFLLQRFRCEGSGAFVMVSMPVMVPRSCLHMSAGASKNLPFRPKYYSLVTCTKLWVFFCQKFLRESEFASRDGC